MKVGWVEKKLGEVISLEYGKPLPEDRRDKYGKYPVYGANGILAWSNEYYHDEPSLIVGRKGSAGEVNYSEEKFWALDVTYFTKFDTTVVDINYLYYQLKKLELPKLAKGVKPGINRNEVYDIDILLPPLAEQKEIVAILDDVFAKIERAKANIEKNLENVEELFQRILGDIFTPKNNWIEKKLKDACTIRPKKSEATNKLAATDLVSFVPMEDLGINQPHLNLQQERLLGDVLGSYTYFADNDVLLAKITPCFENGKVGIAKNLKNGIGFGSSEFLVYRPYSELLSEYLYYFLNQASLRKIGKKTMGGAVGQQRIQKIFYEETLIPLPPLSEQKAIVAALDELKTKTDALKELYTQKLQDLEEMKKTVLEMAFRGELV